MIENLVLIIGITALCMLSPGPDMLLVISNSLRSGRRAGLLTSLGVLTGNLVHITYCLLGLGFLIANSIALYASLKLAGAAYLVYLGVRSLVGAGKRETTTRPAPPVTRSAYVQGLLNNLLNPKGALFYLGVFTQVIRPGTPAPHVAVLVAAMIATSALFWLLFVQTLHVAKLRDLLARSRKSIDRVFGALLIALGLRIAIER